MVGGKQFHTRCAGSGPSVMLVSGYSSDMASWDPVQGRLGAQSRTCAYDRLGIGQSDSPPDRQDFDDLATQLDGVMTALHLTRPVVVVGHSLGGPIAFTWAARHPRDAKAMVLLDPSTPSHDAWFMAHLPKADPGNPDITNLLHDVAFFNDPKTNRESLDPRSMDLIARLPVLATPMRIIEAGRYQGEVPGMNTDAERAAWRAGHASFAKRSTDGTVVVAPRAGHYVQGDVPDDVVAAVEDELR